MSFDTGLTIRFWKWALRRKHLKNSSASCLTSNSLTVDLNGTNFNFFERRDRSAVVKGRSSGMVSTSRCCLESEMEMESLWLFDWKLGVFLMLLIGVEIA